MSSRPMEERIKKKIIEAFEPVHMELVNESKLHEGHAGDDGSGQTHFKLMVVSSRFDECTRMQRHRMINDAVSSLYAEGLHAFSFKALTPNEFQEN